MTSIPILNSQSSILCGARRSAGAEWREEGGAKTWGERRRGGRGGGDGDGHDAAPDETRRVWAGEGRMRMRCLSTRRCDAHAFRRAGGDDGDGDGRKEGCACACEMPFDAPVEMTVTVRRWDDAAPDKTTLGGGRKGAMRMPFDAQPGRGRKDAHAMRCAGGDGGDGHETKRRRTTRVWAEEGGKDAHAHAMGKEVGARVPGRASGYACPRDVGSGLWSAGGDEPGREEWGMTVEVGGEGGGHDAARDESGRRKDARMRMRWGRRWARVSLVAQRGYACPRGSGLWSAGEDETSRGLRDRGKGAASRGAGRGPHVRRRVGCALVVGAAERAADGPAGVDAGGGVGVTRGGKDADGGGYPVERDVTRSRYPAALVANLRTRQGQNWCCARMTHGDGNTEAEAQYVPRSRWSRPEVVVARGRGGAGGAERGRRAALAVPVSHRSCDIRAWAVEDSGARAVAYLAGRTSLERQMQDGCISCAPQAVVERGVTGLTSTGTRLFAHDPFVLLTLLSLLSLCPSHTNTDAAVPLSSQGVAHVNAGLGDHAMAVYAVYTSRARWCGPDGREGGARDVGCVAQSTGCDSARYQGAVAFRVFARARQPSIGAQIVGGGSSTARAPPCVSTPGSEASGLRI
ncbi:hypothetical protein B0H16DRAFT_1850335 [Mycena metata]|uniref:Uncharacterized protein n=1 Tax=Mycena metata TaxID=1033252 RepID=A0AAD7N6I6_9AGAR|nr:hypothetical protein B0H16DRAFT_1850335 [Mycena metata]